MSDELTVEKCLEELREMFPDGAEIKYETNTNWPISILGYGKTTANTRYQLVFRYGLTLSEVMAQVRAFKQSQAKEQVKSE